MGQIKTYPLWVSHSSIGDFLKCPRLYFLHNVYKDIRTNHKIALMNPYLALGQTVHEVVESLSLIKVEDRLKYSLLDKYDKAWEKVSGELGGFNNPEQEKIFKERGKKMIQRIIDNPGPILNKAVKLFSPDSLPPRYYLSKEQDILLCGKIDWLEYVPADDSIHIIDFKTGRNEEDENSLQLPIYHLLVKNLQKRNVRKVSYWYLDKDNKSIETHLPEVEEAYRKVFDVAMKIKQMRISKSYSCLKNGCYACKPYEAILNKEAKFIGTSDYQDIYINNNYE